MAKETLPPKWESHEHHHTNPMGLAVHVNVVVRRLPMAWLTGLLDTAIYPEEG
jgi:hypothetical protein